MARIEIRDDVRRDRRGNGARAFATPARVAGPVLGTVVAVVAAAVAAVLIGLTLPEALLLAGLVFAASSVLAHRTVASTFAGVTLLLVRPYESGERVRIHVDGCPLDAVIVHIGLANTTLATDTGVLVVPNNLLLRNPPAPVAAAQPCPEPCA